MCYHVFFLSMCLSYEVAGVGEREARKGPSVFIYDICVFIQ